MNTVFDIAKFFINKHDECDGDGVSNLKLQKLLYYAKGFYLAINDELLFSDEFEAWNHGPVISRVYHRFKDNGSAIITPDSETPDFGDQINAFLEEVWSAFGGYSAWKLREMTHEESPWINHEKMADRIPDCELKDYFLTRI